MTGPYEWRIDDIERLAKAAAPAHETAALRGDVARLEHTVREISAALDELRRTVEGQAEIIARKGEENPNV